jgi:hypothetical protein
MVLQKFCETGDTAKVLSTTIPLILAIAANHGRYSGPLPVSPAAYQAKAMTVMVDFMSSEDDSDGAGSTGAVIS